MSKRPHLDAMAELLAELRRRTEAAANVPALEIEQATLAELRAALAISQSKLAEALGRSQAAIAQMESRTDMKVSTLRQAIEAMGGELELVARFPAGDVRIAGFGGGED